MYHGIKPPNTTTHNYYGIYKEAKRITKSSIKTAHLKWAPHSQAQGKNMVDWSGSSQCSYLSLSLSNVLISPGYRIKGSCTVFIKSKSIQRIKAKPYQTCDVFYNAIGATFEISDRHWFCDKQVIAKLFSKVVNGIPICPETADIDAPPTESQHAICQAQGHGKDVKSVDGDDESVMSRNHYVGNAQILTEHAITH